jgi:hypothetical protein
MKRRLSADLRWSGNAQPFAALQPPSVGLVVPSRVTCYKGTMAERPIHLQMNYAFSANKVRDGDGHLYALTGKTQGVDLASLHEGQRVVCTVTRKLPRVLTAAAIA